MAPRKIEKPRILLISPSQDERKFQPPGLLHLAAAVKGMAEVRILPADASAMRIRNEAERFKPHIIGASMHFGNEVTAISYVNEAKKVCPNARVVFGGPGILVPEINERILRHSSGTATIEGEAEYTFKKFVETVGTTHAGKLTNKQAKKLKEIRGLSLLHLKKFHPAKQPGDRLDEKGLNRLKLNYGLFERSSAEWMTVSTSRGCPNACIFCTRPHGNKWRAKNPRAIIRELKEIAAKHPEKRVVTFADDTFALSRKRLTELIDRIRKNKLHERFSFTMQATIPSMLTTGKVGERMPDFNLLKKLKEANWTRIEFGLENFVEKERENLGKPLHTTEEAVELLRGTARNGMDAGAFIILGGDDTHTEDIIENGYWAAKLHKESGGRIQFSANPHVIAYPGTPLWNKASAINQEEPVFKEVWPASPDGKQKNAAYLHTNIVVEPRDKLAADILNRVDEKRAEYGSMQELLGIVHEEINRREKQIQATIKAQEGTGGAGWRLFAFTKEAEKLKSLKEKLQEKQEDLERTETQIPP